MNKEEVLLKLKEIECRSTLPAFEKNYTEKDYTIKELERIVFKLLEELDKYKTTIEIYQPYFKGVDMLKIIEDKKIEKLNINTYDEILDTTLASKINEIIDRLNGE